MNERIKELAEQARLGRGPEKIHISENGVVIFYFDELEKFAELIVKECAEVCMKEIDIGWAMAPKSPWMAKQILEHFGIE